MGMAPTKGFEEMAKEADTAATPETTTPSIEKKDDCCGACEGDCEKKES